METVISSYICVRTEWADLCEGLRRGVTRGECPINTGLYCYHLPELTFPGPSWLKSLLSQAGRASPSSKPILPKVGRSSDKVTPGKVGCKLWNQCAAGELVPWDTSVEHSVERRYYFCVIFKINLNGPFCSLSNKSAYGSELGFSWKGQEC